MVELLLELAHLREEGVVVGVRLAELLGDRVELVHHREGLGDAVLDVLEDVLRLVELRLLLEDPDRVTGREHRVAVGGLVEAGHDPQDGRLAGSVGADDADLRTGQEREGDVVQDHLVAVRLARLTHRVDVLSHASSLGASAGRAVVRPRRGHPSPGRPAASRSAGDG